MQLKLTSPVKNIKCFTTVTYLMLFLLVFIAYCFYFVFCQQSFLSNYGWFL